MASKVVKRRYQDGSVVYTARVDLPPGPDGARRQTRLSHAERDKLAELIARKELEVRTGTYLDPSEATVGQWLDERHRQQRRALRPATWLRYRGILDHHLIPTLGGIPLAKLSPFHIEGALARWADGETLGPQGRPPKGGRASGAKPAARRPAGSTVCEWFNVLDGALRAAVKQRLIAANPADQVEPPRRGRTKPGIWTRAEGERFLAANQDDAWLALWQLGLDAGLRRGEALALTWADIDLREARLTVRQAVTADWDGKRVLGEPKSAASARTVPLMARTVAVLRAHRRRWNAARLAAGTAWANPDDRVFVYLAPGLCYDAARRRVALPAGRPLPYKAIDDLLYQAEDRAGVRRVSYHDLRHAHGTRLMEAGVSPKVMSERLGHSDPGFTLRQYSHVLPGVQRAVIGDFERWLTTPPPADDRADDADDDEAADALAGG